MITLRADDVRVDVAAHAGGRIAQIRVGGVPLLIDDDLRHADSMAWGSFPMAPWAGRIRHGRFRFRDREIAVTINHRDGDDDAADVQRIDRSHAIHGTVFARPWTVIASTPRSIDMTCTLDGALAWPFGGVARQHIELSGDRVVCALEVSADDADFPATIGWHPWFVKPDELHVSPQSMYQRDDIGLPTGDLVTPTTGPWDDCFVNTDPVVLTYHRPGARQVTVSSDCDHIVIYDEPAHATCVEPQSGPPDGLTLRPEVVTPDRPLIRHMTISWT